MNVDSPKLTALDLSSSPRRAVLEGAGLLVLLGPLAIAASYVLARHAQAAQPGSAAALTALILIVGAAFMAKWLIAERLHPHARLGLGNVLTFTRASGVAVMAGLVLAPVADLGWALVGLAGAVLALDGADGWAARRAGLQSAFGARLDMESDVAFSLTLAALAVAMGQVGLWFMALGLLRPTFVLGGRIWPALSAPLPDARWRKIMAGMQMAGQVLLIAPLLAPPYSTALGAAILLATMASFSVDLVWLTRRAKRP
jgi:phosphatidylglycerophosphate synthase